MRIKFLHTLQKKKEVLLKKLRGRIAYLKGLWAGASGADIIHSRFFLAVSAIAMSLIIWCFVAWDGNTEGSRSIDVPIQYTNLARGFTIYDSDTTVQVRVLGRVNMLTRTEISEFSAEVDLQALQTGKYKLPIKIEVPSFLRVRSWNPSAASVEIYRQIERTLPVTWKLEGKLEASKIIAGVDISPSEVTLAGPEADVLAVQAIEVTIPAARLTTGTTLKLPVKLTEAPAQDDKMLVSPGSVSVKVTLEEEIIGEQIPVTVAVAGELADGLEIDEIKIIPDKVTIRGSGEAVRKMTSLTLSPIDVSGLEQNLQLVLPLQSGEPIPGIEIVGSERVRIEITVRKKMAAKTYTVPVTIIGATSGVELSISPHSAALTVEGSQAIVDSLTGYEAPCELYVDVSNIVTRQINLPILVRKLQKDFEIIQIEPEQVIVTRTDLRK